MSLSEIADAVGARAVLGHFATGIVVVTAAGPQGPIGFTCQSFSALSLDPLLISFAAAKTSSTWPRIRELAVFCANVLAEDQEHLSTRFARSGRDRSVRLDKFAGVKWRPSPAGAPVLDGGCAWIECTLGREYDGGDHTIVVGQVTALAAAPHRAPLLYHRGCYGLPLTSIKGSSTKGGYPS